MKQPTKQQKSNLSFELSKALTECHNAALRFEAMSNEKYVTGYTKKMFRDFVRGLRRIEREIKMQLISASWEVMKSELLNDEDTLQFSAVTDMFLSLPKEDRDKVELVLQNFYNSNKKKEESNSNE